MRYRLPLSATVCCLLLALAIPSILIAEAANSNRAITPDKDASANSSQRPSVDAGAGGDAPARLTEHESAAAERVRQNYGRLPLSFEANLGQADARAQFLARNSAYNLYLGAGGITLALLDEAPRAPQAGRSASGASVLRIKLLGASRAPRARGLDELQGKSNYLVGNDPARWRTNVPHYARVKYEAVYPGVDVIYYGTNRQLEYDFLVAAGADAGLIRLRVEGALGLRVDENGDLVLPTAAGEVRQHAPHAYQEVAGVRRTVASRYVLRGGNRVGFELGEYDRSLPLVIDPVVSYSTHLGGTGFDEGYAVAVDAQGNAYVTGNTDSTDFPVTPNAFQRNVRSTIGDRDAFVTKLNADGTAIVYSTYLGGNFSDVGRSIAVDATGQAHVAGETESSNFPVTPGAHRTTKAGWYDVFVSKLCADGSALLYSTYLGGNTREHNPRVALAAGGEVYVSGLTHSANFPTTPGSFQPQPRGVSEQKAEGFLTKLAMSPGAGLVFSTYLGGGGDDHVEGLAVASGLDGSVYVTGRTSSADFPTTPNAWQRTLATGGSGNDYDAFVTRLDSAGTQALFSTYFGGAGYDYASAVAVDGAGAAYVAGSTSSASLHVTPGAFQTTYGSAPGDESGLDAFVAKLSADGASVLYSTFFGGGGVEVSRAVAVDAQGNAYVAGDTDSTNLPAAAGGWQPAYGGGFYDGFFFKLNADGSAVPYSTYLGGDSWDHLRGLALDATGDAYLVGSTYSENFYAKPGSLQTDLRGAVDCFVTKLALGAQDYSLTGRVTNEYGNGLVDVEIGVGGTVSRTARTDAEGYYRVNGLPQGAELTITARRLGFVFDPPEGVTLSNLSQNETVNFSGPAPLLVRGHLRNAEADFALGLWPVTVSGTVNQTVQTDHAGYYVFPLPSGGTYTVTPGPDPEFVYAPPTQTVNELIGDQTLDFDVQRSPRIDGRVVDDQYGFDIPNIQVTLTGPTLPEPLVQTTGEWSGFSFRGLEHGATYTVTPVDPVTNRTFVPAQQTVTVNHVMQFVEFEALPPLAIYGQAADASGRALPGTVAKLVGATNPATAEPNIHAESPVDEWGIFVFENLPRGGDYTVTITNPDPLYTFSPPDRTVFNLQEMQFFEFTALPPLRIIGQVADANWRGVRATVTLSGAKSATVQTDEDGIYEFVDLPRGGDYTVTPSLPLYTFAPPSRTFTDIQEDQFCHFEALPPLRIMGGVSDENWLPLAGVTVTLSGAKNATAQTDEHGSYEFADLPRGGDYAVTAAHALYNFTPPRHEFPAMNADQVAGFDAALRRFALRGRVTAVWGAPLPGTTVTLGGGADRITQAGPNGYYDFTDLVVGRDYTVAVARPGYAFTPESVNVTDPRGDQTVDFNTGSRLAYDLTGRITDASGGAGLAGVSVSLTGWLALTTQTDAQGNYTFPDLPSEGNYTATPSHPNYNFAPSARPFTNLLSDVSADFAGTRITYLIGGRVKDSSGVALPGVSVTLSGAQSATTQTNSNGDYSFTNLAAGGDYSVTPSHANFTFAPPSRGFANLSSNQTGDFTATLNTHSISGRVTDAADNALANVSVALAGPQSAAAQTDAGGNYSFANLPAGGSYTVTPTLANYTFAPPSRAFSNLAANQTGDFKGTLNTHTISGRVSDSAGNALAGATVTLGGARSATAQTDAAGNYLFADLPAGFDYTLTVAKTHYAFSPPTRQFNDLGGDATADFNAALLTHAIGGRVVDSNGNGFAGALVSLTGTRTGSVTTDAAGNYSFTSLPAGGNYAVEPSREFYDFSPARGVFNDLGGDQSANFTAALRRFSIGGRVAEGAGGVAGVTVTLGGSQTAAVQTDAAGNYLFTQLPANGSYTVTPAHPFFAFSPGGTTFNTLPSDQSANFAAARHLYQIGGYALDPCGRPITGLTMSLARDGVTANAQTNAAGFYSFTGVPAGYNYTLAPTGSTHTFNPPSASLPGLNANQSISFTGTPPVSITDAPALADTYARGGSATTNFGTATQLITRLANQTKDTHETYVKFDAGRPCIVSSVKLRLYGRLSSSGTIPAALYAVPATTWTETGLNWNNKPAAGALLRAVNVAGTTAAWYEWDVTDYVRGEIAAGRGTVSFVIKSAGITSYQAVFNSREATGTNAPRLVVTVQ